MKKTITLFVLSFFFLNCKSQNLKVKNLEKKVELNYVIANLQIDNTVQKELWDRSQFIKIFTISDSKATPKGLFEGTDEVLSSLIISATPDGDYYTKSKLYKIEGINNPKITEIKEGKFPEFSITIEHGFYDKRKSETFKFKGVQ
ncbi:hypothetical protein [Flavobacterium gilvum]|uniref:Uncharacterized protein n=1 Tax=Flavobacterium gilvum TaxID=1492737 RepID=A0AAC9I3U0_9FLAO|nr:hypothetical protein [Flavobacterium gilvum]AOW09796.1 hypothetical protein EM308_09920 [Flavobacterium gilvum]KFC60342.1 short chain dehydrogenase [Flavobacterium gilvum]